MGTTLVLASGELAIETDTHQFKLGDGTTVWNSLAYGGLQGNIGPTGLQGISGLQGPAGIGIQGVIGATGPQGVQGLQGFAGAAGLAGIGIQGVIGVTGPQGVQGLQGLLGAAGPAGGLGGQGAMGVTGQKCTATRRAVAVGDAYEPLLSEIIRQTEALVVGDGMDSATQIGPLVSERAKADVAAAVNAALVEGAQIAAQAQAPAGGAYYPPTILTGDSGLAICREEVFGPVLTVLCVDTVDDAIALANSTPFGLSATVLTHDERTIRRCIERLDAGVVKANAPTTGTELHVPFGGLKDSTYPAPREQNAETVVDFLTWTKSAYTRLVPE
ncbi:MAG: aldehyde dehydrogenase family protein [Thermoleophilia bacterium]|nr:aldehyde dehydrogenase family protein [Thermoleophilia bacterium]